MNAYDDDNGASLVDYDLGGCRALVLWVPVSALFLAAVAIGWAL